MLLGFLFLLIVLRRDILHRRAMEIKDVYTLVGRKYGRLGLSGGRKDKENLKTRVIQVSTCLPCWSIESSSLFLP